MSRAVGAALVLAGVLGASGCGLTRTSTHTVTVTRTVTRTVTTTATTAPPPSSPAACTGSDLGGSFAVQAGSAGAGHISYTLQLTNTSSAPCAISGVPALQLLDRNGGQLPTTVSPAQGAGSQVVLQPGRSAVADVRFTPDVPGPGEPQTSQCEPTATKLAVTPTGGGSFTVDVAPPTPVCVSGALSVSSLRAAG